MSELICRNVRVDGRRTSIKLEAGMWEALHEICERLGRNLNEVCTEVHRRGGASSFTSSMRLFILEFYRESGRRRNASPQPRLDRVSADGPPVP